MDILSNKRCKLAASGSINLQHSRNIVTYRPDSCGMHLMFLYLQNCFVMFINTTRSTQRAQTSLAEADHYSHIAHCKNVEPWL